MNSAQLPLALDFTSYVNKSTQDFTGREWVFGEISRWLARAEGKRFFSLTGEPGSGKTAIAARLFQFSRGTAQAPGGSVNLAPGFLKGAHFCSTRDRYWINPRVFTQSLASHLAHAVPGFAQALLKRSGDRQVDLDVNVRVESGSAVGVVIHNLNMGEVTPEDAFARLIREPLEEVIQSGCDGQIVILVDALDEALLYTQDVGIPALITEVEQLPSNVRFIVTTRPTAELLRPLRRIGAEERSLTANDGIGHSLVDIESYVLRRLQDSKRLAGLLAADLAPGVFGGAIREKSAGNFLYVTLLLRALEVEDEVVSLTSLERFPGGLDEFYLEFLERLKKKKRSEIDELLLLLGVLAVSREPLKEHQLSALVGRETSEIRQRLGHIRQFLETEESAAARERAYAIFHRSFVDFLLDSDRSEEFWRERKEMHRRFVSAYFVDADPLTLNHPDDKYLWRHLLSHLNGAGMVDVACKLLLSYAWLEAKLIATDMESLLSDFDVLQPDEALSIVREVLVLSSHFLPEDPRQIKGQILGRMLAEQNVDIQPLVQGAAAAYQGTTALRPLTPCLVRPAGPLLQTLRVFDDAIEGVAFGPGGKSVIAVTDRFTNNGDQPGVNFAYWQLNPPRLLREAVGHTRQAQSLALSADSRTAVVGGREQEPMLRQDGSPIIEGGEGVKTTSLDGDGCLRVWDAQKWKERFRIICPLDNMAHIAIAGNQVLAIDKDWQLRAWELETGVQAALPELRARWDRLAARGGYAAAVTSSFLTKRRERRDKYDAQVAWYQSTWGVEFDDPPADDSRTVLTDEESKAEGEDDENYVEVEVEQYKSVFVVWNVDAADEYRMLPGTPVADIDVTEDGERLIVITSKGEVKLFEVSTGRVMFQAPPAFDLDSLGSTDDKFYHYVCFLSDGSRACSVSGHFTSHDPPAMRVWDLISGRELLRHFGHTAMVTALNTSYPHSLVGTGTMEGEVKIWDTDRSLDDNPAERHTRRVNALAVSPDGRIACSAADDATVCVWDLKEYKLIAKMRGHKDRVSSVAFSVDGKRIITASSDCTIRIWKADNLREEKTLVGHEDGVNAVAVHPDGKRILSTSDDVSIRWWDLKTGRSRILRPTVNRVHVPTQLAWDGSGKRFALGQGISRGTAVSSDVLRTSMVVWDAAEDEFIAGADAFDDVEGIAMSQDGAFAYYTVRHRVRKLRIDGSEDLFSVEHAGDATGVSLLPGEKYAVSVSRGGDILVWGCERGEIITRFLLDESLEACAMSRDGRTLVVGDSVGQVHFFRLEGYRFNRGFTAAD